MKKIFLCLFFCFLLKVSNAQEDNSKHFPEQSISFSLFPGFSNIYTILPNSLESAFSPTFSFAVGVGYEYRFSSRFSLQLGFRYIRSGANWNNYDEINFQNSEYNVNVYYSYLTLPIGGRFYFGNKDKSLFLLAEVIPAAYVGGYLKFIDSTRGLDGGSFSLVPPSHKLMLFGNIGIGKRIILTHRLYAEGGLYYENAIFPLDEEDRYKSYFNALELGFTIGRKL